MASRRGRQDGDPAAGLRRLRQEPGGSPSEAGEGKRLSGAWPPTAAVGHALSPQKDPRGLPEDSCTCADMMPRPCQLYAMLLETLRHAGCQPRHGRQCRRSWAVGARATPSAKPRMSNVGAPLLISGDDRGELMSGWNNAKFRPWTQLQKLVALGSSPPPDRTLTLRPADHADELLDQAHCTIRPEPIDESNRPSPLPIGDLRNFSAPAAIGDTEAGQRDQSSPGIWRAARDRRIAMAISGSSSEAKREAGDLLSPWCARWTGR